MGTPFDSFRWDSALTQDLTGRGVSYVVITGNNETVNLTGLNDAILAATGSDTVNLTGCTNTFVDGGNNFTLSADSTTTNTTIAAGNGSTLTVNGSNDTITQGDGGTTWLTGSASSDLTTVGNNVTKITISGTNDTTSTGTGDTVWVSFSANNDTTNVGNSAVSVTVSGTDDTTNVGSNAASVWMDGYSAGDVTSVGANSTLTVSGEGDVGIAQSSSTLWLNGDFDIGLGASGDKLLVSGLVDSNTVGTLQQIAVTSVNQVITLGSSPAYISASTANAGVKIVDGGSPVLLDLSGGGNASLNATDTGTSTDPLIVVLRSATNITLSAMSFVDAIGTVTGNTITALATNQTLGGMSGGDTLVGYNGFGDKFVGTSTGLNGDLIKNFGGSDKLDITDMVNSSTKLSWAANASGGVLTVSDGTHSTALNFIGSYSATSFVISGSDGNAGTLIL